MLQATRTLVNLKRLPASSSAALITVLLSIQDQLAQGSVPPDYIRRGVVAPWMQVEVLSLLRVTLELPEVRSLLSQETWEALDTTSARAMDPSKEVAAQAVAFEAVRLAAVIGTKGDKLEAKALAIGMKSGVIIINSSNY